MKDSVMEGRRGLQVMENGHLFTWNTKSLDPNLEVWWSGTNIFFGDDLDKKMEIFWGDGFLLLYSKMEIRQFSEDLEVSKI